MNIFSIQAPAAPTAYLEADYGNGRNLQPESI
jgi:hypothetical protein